jgi:N-methylhydantoinase A/oxoprolinase/acetone carboxylase beta subunit
VLRVGVDTGGTFTDFVLVDGAQLRVHKVPSTPEDPSRAILAGLHDLIGEAAGPDVVHGSTVATNAVLERRGARIALVATAGFEDVLRIGRQTRRALYDFQVADRRPLVAPELTFGVRERMGHDGLPLQALEPTELEALAERLMRAGVEAVAVCLLHSYVNPAHELQIAERLARAPSFIVPSHEVLPEYREFERWSTTAVSAYVTPLMARYLATLEERLGGATLRVMQSNGGTMSAAAARRGAVQTILSGPAGGARGALAVAAAAGYDRVIAFDMGGTSTDVTSIDGGLDMTSESTVGDVPVRLPMIDIHTVGAGGGSIAYLDVGGALRVGPRSAGADPGPACYGRGTELTVTDAHLLLGRLDPTAFLGGRMSLDEGRARRVAAHLAARAGLDVPRLAEGVLRVANASMERAVRVVSVQRGRDPRRYALVAFGGAGGMHACELAAALDIPTVIVPRHAGVLSALGMLLADVTRDFSHTVLSPAVPALAPVLGARLAALEERATAAIAQEGFAGARVALERSVDVRYVGQSFEITVPFDDDYRSEFDRRHERVYGYADPRRPAEIVTVRVRGIGLHDKPVLPREDGVAHDAVPDDVRRAWFQGRKTRTAFHRLERLAPGGRGRGAAVIAGAETTIVVPPGFDWSVDSWGNVVARPGRSRRHRSAERDRA